jgi:hypothetical protein
MAARKMKFRGVKRVALSIRQVYLCLERAWFDIRCRLTGGVVGHFVLDVVHDKD